jgi:hypothetical protein
MEPKAFFGLELFWMLFVIALGVVLWIAARRYFLR